MVLWLQVIRMRKTRLFNLLRYLKGIWVIYNEYFKIVLGN